MPARITPLGVFKVHPDSQAYELAKETCGSAEAAADEMQSIVLVELLVEDADATFDIGKVSYAPHGEALKNAQAPYDESYLDRESGAVIAENFRKPQASTFVVVFYLHYYNPEKPLDTPSGPIMLPPVTQMPERLAWKHYEYYD